MLVVNSSASTAAPNEGELWTIRGLVARHRLATLGVGVVVVVALALFLLPLFGSRAAPVTDATSCTQWGSANQDQQAAYARLYVREHGPLRGGSTSPASVIAAINNGCLQAYGNDLSDNVSVSQAISGNN